jgi:ABC-type lipoprotein release transport system permease subunit
LTLVVAAAVFLVVAFIASLLPAVRAAGTTLVHALRAS